ncbi:MAG: 16S rRNA (guanine(527)-N(7))-methyltransferase RsmG [Clostridiales bacterium]|nr:16S rRNA (guanine(527)-N(7))-methyltransferase RsmG [Clostridiales bacterium]MCF8022478.1 16S rRNA (guanine(527)-N(7))-methyltransferase RsmG [Clostridiales bacterium]
MKPEPVFNNLLISGAENIGLKLSSEHLEKFNIYYQLLIEENKKTNLTNLINSKSVAIKHFIDSLSCISVINFNKLSNLVDVGTGAGFPGLPLKIIYPHLKISLIESKNKKVNFLNMVTEKLSLGNVFIYNKRVEDLASLKQNRELYDICVSRAVASLEVLSEYCLPLVKPGGIFTALKGPDVNNEINKSLNVIKLLGGRIENLYEFKLPFLDEKRIIINIKKVSKTPEKYPRKPGIPEKRPLL